MKQQRILKSGITMEVLNGARDMEHGGQGRKQHLPSVQFGISNEIESNVDHRLATTLLSSSGRLIAVDLALRPVLRRIMAISCSSKMEMNEIMKNEK